MIYLSTPFTRYHMGPEAAFIHASRLAGRLVAKGRNVFSPIAHSFPIAIYGGVDLYDGELWNRINAPYMAMCSEIYIAKMDGWRASEGIAWEVENFRAAKKPIHLLNPETLELFPYNLEVVRA
jgi:hypothetical protein